MLDRVAVEGTVSIEETETGVVFRRVDAAYGHQLLPEVDFVAASPSGVRLVFATEAAWVELDLLATRAQTLPKDAQPWSVDLVVDGVLVESRSSEAGHRFILDNKDPANLGFEAGEPATLRFAIPPGSRQIELWLPTSAHVEVRRLEADGPIMPPDADERPRWVHHGSSISHCIEAHSPTRSWPAVAARLADVQLLNLGLAGQCQLDQFSARTMRDQPADLLSLKVGINLVTWASMRERTFASALHGFLDTVRDGHPDTPFLVVSAIACPAVEDTPGPTVLHDDGVYRAIGNPDDIAHGALTLRRSRELVAAVVEARQDPHLHYLDGLQLFGPDDVADLPDGLHPNGDGYVRIGERFAPKLRQFLRS
jgi:lysophospholipase L1-like esterase